jgi:hypothetical protein
MSQRSQANSSQSLDESSAVLHDIIHEKPLLRRFSWGLMLVIGLPAMLVCAYVASVGGAVQPLPIFAVAVLVGVLISLYGRDAKRRQRRVVERIVADAPGASDVELIEAFIARRAGFRADAGVEALAKRLVAAGRRNVSVRVGPAKDAVAVEPIRVPFEPCLLDEAEDALVDLDAYTRGGDGGGGSALAANTADKAVAPSDEAHSAVATVSERRALRRFRRNMRVRGVGWLLIGIFAFNTLIAALESWQKGAVQWSLVYWPAFLVVLVYGPTRGGLFRGSQWMAVPGGLVLRKGATLGKQWTVHVFDRRRSVLVVFRNFRQQWAFSVSDGAEAGTGAGTHREVTLLLRAWLSPLEPPGLERLSDLA